MIVLQEQIDWINFLNLIREHYGDEKLFFTFVPFKNEEVCQEYVSAFAADNIEDFLYWGALMHAKLHSGSIDAISLVLRIFLSEKVIMYVKRQKKAIPKKELYHLLITPEKLVLFTEQETEENQNTDAVTGKPLKAQRDLVYKSSIDLYQHVLEYAHNNSL